MRRGSGRRWLWIGAGAVAVALTAGGLYYARGRSQVLSGERDPALGLVIGIRALERDQGARLTDEQVSKILPFLKALKDIPASDVEQVRAVVRSIGDALTPEQKGFMDEMRRRIQAGRRPGGPPRGGGPPSGGLPGAGAPGSGRDPEQFRARIFEATIRMLEQRAR